MRVLSELDVRQNLDPKFLISALEIAFRERYREVHIPARVQMELAEAIFLIMPCYDGAGHALSMKLVTVRCHPVRPEERVQATVMLLDPATGQPRLLIPANHLTDVRTAATSALATKFLASENAKTLGVFGIGRQARAHLKILPLVRNFERALVCGTDPERTKSFCSQMSREVGFPVEAARVERCAADSDVLCMCTTAQAPLFDGKLVRDGAHLNLVGSFQPHVREVDSVAIRRAMVTVETYDGVLAEAGDLLIPLREGVIERDHVKMDLHELLNADRFDRAADQITLFKSVGCGLEDLVAAELIEKHLATR